MSQPKILIIDDDADYQSMLRKCLERAGYDCVSVYCVEDALKQVVQVAPDLVILDLGFQQASGFAFLENLSNYLKDKQKVPPVLVISGYSDQEIIEFVSSLGACSFISKPATSSQIISAVQSFMH